MVPEQTEAQVLVGKVDTASGGDTELNLKGRAGFGAGCEEEGCGKESSDGCRGWWSPLLRPTPPMTTANGNESGKRVGGESPVFWGNPSVLDRLAVVTMARAPGLLLNQAAGLC